MANVLPKEKQVAIIAALAEGNSIRSVERMTNVHRDTIMRLAVKVGEGCEKLLDEKMNGLKSKCVEIDEIWGYVGCKDRTMRFSQNAHYGSVWTFVAVDADTKIVPCYRVGKRDSETANAFLNDLSLRLADRIQLSSDGLPAYFDAVRKGF